MKYKILIITFLSTALLAINCDEVYDYDVNDTTWDIYVSWEGGFYLGEPQSITFCKDGTTDWGGTWEKTDRLTFEWKVEYTDDCGTYTATYLAMFRQNLSELIGHCSIKSNCIEVEGEFFAYKNDR